VTGLTDLTGSGHIKAGVHLRSICVSNVLDRDVRRPLTWIFDLCSTRTSGFDEQTDQKLTFRSVDFTSKLDENPLDAL